MNVTVALVCLRRGPGGHNFGSVISEAKQCNDDSKLLGTKMKKNVKRHIRLHPIGHRHPSWFTLVGNTLYCRLDLQSPELQEWGLGPVTDLQDIDKALRSPNLTKAIVTVGLRRVRDLENGGDWPSAQRESPSEGHKEVLFIPISMRFLLQLQ